MVITTETGTPSSPHVPRSYLSTPEDSPLVGRARTEHARLLATDSPLNEKPYFDDDTSFDAGPVPPPPPPPPPVFEPPRRRLHPLALLPAFLLGIAISFAATRVSVVDDRGDLSPPWTHHVSPDTQLLKHDSGLVFLDPSAYIRAEEKNTSQPTAEHPILTLVREAEQQWNEKHRRRSGSLTEAVAEYRKRYGRAPPKGFDRYTFAIDNGVIFHDEYDGLHANLEPFWAVPPALLRDRRDRLSNLHSTETNHVGYRFTFDIKGGQIDISSELDVDAGRIQEHRKFCEAFVDQLEDVTLVMSHEDGPRAQIDYEARQRHLRAARDGRVLSVADADHVDDDGAWFGNELTCAPESRLRRAANGLEVSGLPRGMGFIGTNHVKAMDVCENPEWRLLHGSTLYRGVRPRTFVPIASMAKMTMNTDILVPALEQFFDHEPWDPAWADKPRNKAVWRGSTTGIIYNSTTFWRRTQRPRLTSLARDRLGRRRVRFSDPEGRIVERIVEHATLSDRYLDAAFAGEAIQCDDECDIIAKELDLVPFLSWPEQNEFKYMIDIDGNAWSGRFRRLMSSNSLVLKSTVFTPFYAETLQPWYHYIPLRIDYEDIYDILAFFIGDLDGENGHDELAERIATQGKRWAEEHFRLQDSQAYMFRLYLELARLYADDRSSMDYVQQ